MGKRCFLEIDNVGEWRVGEAKRGGWGELSYEKELNNRPDMGQS